MLGLTLSTAAAKAILGCTRATAGTEAAPARRLATLLADFAEELLRAMPDDLTRLGLDGGARAALGDRFDVTARDDALVRTGGLPLALLGATADQFIAER